MKEQSKKEEKKNIIEILADNERPLSNLIDSVNKIIENVSTQFLRHKKSDM